MTQLDTKSLDSFSLRHRLDVLTSSQNIHQWDLGAACSTDNSVQVDRGEPKQLKAAERRSVTIRVWNQDGLVGITSTSDLSDAGLAKALNGAKQASAFGNRDETPAFSPLASAPLAEFDQPICTPAAINILLDSLKQAEADLNCPKG